MRILKRYNNVIQLNIYFINKHLVMAYFSIICPLTTDFCLNRDHLLTFDLNNGCEDGCSEGCLSAGLIFGVSADISDSWSAHLFCILIVVSFHTYEWCLTNFLYTTPNDWNVRSRRYGNDEHNRSYNICFNIFELFQYFWVQWFELFQYLNIFLWIVQYEITTNLKRL